MIHANCIQAIQNDFKHLTLIDKDISSVIRSLSLLTSYGLELYEEDSNRFVVKGFNSSMTLHLIEHSFDTKLESMNVGFTHAFANASVQHFDLNAFLNLRKFLDDYILPDGFVSLRIRFTDHILPFQLQGFYHHIVPRFIWFSVFLKGFPFWTNRLLATDYLDLFDHTLYNITTDPSPVTGSTASCLFILARKHA